MSLPDLDILEVKSVSDMISVFETPADDAAKLIGEDDVAIFSPQLDLMIVTSQYDLEEPVATSQTVICYSDIMTADDLDLDLPELESHAVAVPATPEQLAEVKALVKRGEKVHNGCDPSEDNMLKITGDGRKVALDPKLLYLEDDPDMEPLSGGKVDACVRNILDIRERTEAERGA